MFNSSNTTSGTASVVLQSVLIIPSLVLYVLVTLGLISTLKLTKYNFYFLMISLAIADICYLCETLFYSIPCVVLQKAIYGDVMERIIGHLDTTTWFLQCSHYLFISINRLKFVAGNSLNTFDKVFTKRKTLWCLFGIWIFSISMTILSEIAQCRKIFDVDGFYWKFICPTDNSENFGMIINGVVSGLFCLLSGVLSLFIWITVKCKRHNLVTNQQNLWARNSNRISTEMSMCIQFTAITACAVMNYLGFWIFDKIFSARAATMMIQVFGIANAAINPYIYLIFNKMLRTRLRNMCHCQKTPTVVVDLKVIAWAWPTRPQSEPGLNRQRQ